MIGAVACRAAENVGGFPEGGIERVRVVGQVSGLVSRDRRDGIGHPACFL